MSCGKARQIQMLGSSSERRTDWKCKTKAASAWLVLFVLMQLCAACRPPLCGQPYQDAMPAWRYTTGSGKQVSVAIRSYPRSSWTEVLFQQRTEDFNQEVVRVEAMIAQEKSPAMRKRFESWLTEVNSGAAFLSPFSLKDWPMVLPSRIFLTNAEPALCLVIARHQPSGKDVSFILESGDHLTATELKETITNTFATLGGRAPLASIPQSRTPIFDPRGNVTDPHLRKLFEDQIFLQQR